LRATETALRAADAPTRALRSRRGQRPHIDSAD
jgi:hypothetical protein